MLSLVHPSSLRSSLFLAGNWRHVESEIGFVMDESDLQRARDLRQLCRVRACPVSLLPAQQQLAALRAQTQTRRREGCGQISGAPGGQLEDKAERDVGEHLEVEDAGVAYGKRSAHARDHHVPVVACESFESENVLFQVVTNLSLQVKLARWRCRRNINKSFTRLRI